MKLVTFSDAIMTGKPFRHWTMKEIAEETDVPVWFTIHSDTEVHVSGPDDIMPMDEAIPLIWRSGEQFEIQD